jgi:hypothetical protein
MSEAVKLAAEEFERGMTRRRLIRRTFQTTFFAVAYFALDGLTASRPALAASCYGNFPPETFCNPPTAGYCSSHSSSYCSGADCAGGCATSGCGGYTASANCWCTQTSCSPNGYYICCDCDCSSVGGPGCCVCSQFVSTTGCRPPGAPVE